MTTYSATLDLPSALGPPGACPACGGAPLHPVSTETGVDFVCAVCRCHWHLELGRVRAVPSAPGPRD